MEKIAGILFPVVDSSVERGGHFFVDSTMACILLDLKATWKKSLMQSDVSFLSGCLSSFLYYRFMRYFIPASYSHYHIPIKST